MRVLAGDDVRVQALLLHDGAQGRDTRRGRHGVDVARHGAFGCSVFACALHFRGRWGSKGGSKGWMRWMRWRGTMEIAKSVGQVLVTK
ncbi:unnamed protein product [Chondrus crispus]|uniref:Uncharacterized protein n=1 Tax=Chondrus crispus TaxID=2769 RepID=R7Q513_CHOCR|nr:unnamed protein product [Chondrus crispus]CDF32530.1 unnamed protein product [Chondrus crispus]|eukprot:XP_005712195.1 unnamed protein product [Chondrus crispus]